MQVSSFKLERPAVSSALWCLSPSRHEQSWSCRTGGQQTVCPTRPAVLRDVLVATFGASDQVCACRCLLHSLAGVCFWKWRERGGCGWWWWKTRGEGGEEGTTLFEEVKILGGHVARSHNGLTRKPRHLPQRYFRTSPITRCQDTNHERGQQWLWHTFVWKRMRTLQIGCGKSSADCCPLCFHIEHTSNTTISSTSLLLSTHHHPPPPLHHPTSSPTTKVWMVNGVTMFSFFGWPQHPETLCGWSRPNKLCLNGEQRDHHLLGRMQATASLCFSVQFVEQRLGQMDQVRAGVRTDSQIARAAWLSEGLRNMKHIELKFLFVQEVTKRGPDRNHLHINQKGNLPSSSPSLSRDSTPSGVSRSGHEDEW